MKKSWSRAIGALATVILSGSLFAGPAAVAFSRTAAHHAPAKKWVVGFIPGITTDAFYISMLRGARAEAAKLGVELDVQGASQWNYTLQTQIVQDMITRKVNLLVIAPNDANAMIAPLKQAVNAHIPVITVDTTVNDPGILVSRITSNNVQGGAVAADTLAKLIGGAGDVAVINVTPGISTTDERQAGFLAEIKKKYPKIHVVATEYSNDQQNTASIDTENILLAHPHLKGIFATNDVNSGGVAEALKAKGKAAQVKLVAYDAEPEAVSALMADQVQALVVQKPYLEGQLAVEYAYDELAGHRNEIRKSVVLANVVADQANKKDPSITRWYYTS